MRKIGPEDDSRLYSMGAHPVTNRNKYPKAHDHGNPQNQRGDSPDNPVHVKVVEGEDKSSENLDSSLNSSKRWFGVPDWWIAIGTLVLASFTILSFVVLFIQLHDAREFFTEDRRPIIWIKNLAVPQMKLGEKASWNFSYTNYGKSPATGVAVKAQIVLGGPDISKYPKDWDQRIHFENEKATGIVIPPGDDSNYSTAFSKEPVTAEDVAYAQKYDGGMVMMVYFEYYDLAGNIYESRVCKLTRLNGAFGICELHNEIK